MVKIKFIKYIKSVDDMRVGDIFERYDGEGLSLIVGFKKTWLHGHIIGIYTIRLDKFEYYDDQYTPFDEFKNRSDTRICWKIIRG